jgi:hypothetical protein
MKTLSIMLKIKNKNKYKEIFKIKLLKKMKEKRKNDSILFIIYLV